VSRTSGKEIPSHGFREDELIQMMVGRKIDDMYPRSHRPTDDVVLAVEKLRLLPGAPPLSLTVRRGEVVGISGLVGSGRTALLKTIFGARPLLSGRIRYDGRKINGWGPARLVRAGVAYLSEDRKTEGLMLPMSVRDNLTLAVLGEVSRGGVIRPWREKATVATAIERLRIKTRDAATQQVGTLSGGNQQKVLIGRWLLTQPDVLLLFDITRGVDVGTKHDIYELVVQLAAEGKALLYYSSETEEIAQLCNRVLVMREGRIVAELDRNADAEAVVAASVRVVRA